MITLCYNMPILDKLMKISYKLTYTIYNVSDKILIINIQLLLWIFLRESRFWLKNIIPTPIQFVIDLHNLQINVGDNDCIIKLFVYRSLPV